MWRELNGHVPLIGINGVLGADDVVRMALSGACAVEFASVVLTAGRSFSPQILRDLRAYCEGKPISLLQIG